MPFRSRWGLLLSGTLSAGSASAATLHVGPGQTFATPCAAIAAARAGDTVEVDASGSYAGDTCSWSTDNLTILGINGRPKIDLTGVAPSEMKGIFTITAANATIDNVELTGSAIAGGACDGCSNGAGIRHQGQNLIVRNSYIHDNQDGILGGPLDSTGMPAPNTGSVLIENTEFYNNGAGDGYTHNVYLGNYATATLQYSWSHHASVGHLFKSRAYQTFVLYNRLTDEAGGTASLELDIPNAGTAYVIGNLIEQSAASQNSNIVSFGEEGVPIGYDTHLFLVSNTILNDLMSGTFVNNKAVTPAILTNNIFYNGGTISSNNADVLTTNFDSSMGNPMFVNPLGYDVELTSGSPCIDKGTAPGSGVGESLTPAYEYVQPVSEVPRKVVGPAIDIGAFEYGNPRDGGTVAADSGLSPSDSGLGARRDSGARRADASVGRGDGGGPSIDGGAGPRGRQSGCGCRAGGPGDIGCFGVSAEVLLAVTALRRRRTRR